MSRDNFEVIEVSLRAFSRDELVKEHCGLIAQIWNILPYGDDVAKAAQVAALRSQDNSITNELTRRATLHGNTELKWGGVNPAVIRPL